MTVPDDTRDAAVWRDEGRDAQVPRDFAGDSPVPRDQARLWLAVRAGLPAAYPLAWAALTAANVTAVRGLLGRHRVGGYAQWRDLLTAGEPPAERGEPAAAEVIALRVAAGAMDRDDPRAEMYVEAAGRLEHLMFRDVTAGIVAGAPRSPHLDRVRAARAVPVTAAWGGPVVELWLRTLTPVPDLPALLRLHRVAALLSSAAARAGEVHAAYQDRDGRYVLVFGDPEQAPSMCAEWPRDPAVTATWTDATVLCVDRPVAAGPAGPMLMITTEGDGTIRADPLPLALTDGGGPSEFGAGHRDAARHLLRRLLALAVPPRHAEFAARPFVLDLLTSEPGMLLWPALATPGPAIRLRWGAIRARAGQDLARVRRLLAPGEPPVYRYFAVLRDAAAPLDKAFQVVRRSAETDEQIAPGGEWAPSLLLTAIEVGRSDHEYRRLEPPEIDRCVAAIRARL